MIILWTFHSMWRMLPILGVIYVAASASSVVNILQSTKIDNQVDPNTSFSDCNIYTSCTQCVSALFQCDWCLDAQRCTNNTAENCRNDILITSVSRNGPSYRSGPSFCPRINSNIDGINEILVHFGFKKAIKVKVHVLGQFIVQTRFVCQFKIEGRISHVNAQLLGDTIYCDHFEFTYNSNVSNLTASFAVIWGGSKLLDNPDNIHIQIYKCNAIARNCGDCLKLTENFGCGWCQRSNRCALQEQCEAQSDWISRTQTCPDTEISTPKPSLEDINPESLKCSALSSCTQCVNAPYLCDWCLDAHRCTNDTAENCRNDILITSVSRNGPSYRSGPSFCPRINSNIDGINEILVHFGFKKAIKVKVHVLGQFIVQTRFVCQFKIEGRISHVNAQLLGDTIYCDHFEFTYNSNVSNLTASFAVIWGGSKLLDNPDNIHIQIYKCNAIARNCGDCLKLTENFGCGWCQRSNRCALQEQCEAQSDWISRTQTCPDTEISTPKPSLEDTNPESLKCSALSSCTQCVNAPYLCDWCLDAHRCTNDTAENCRNDILITSASRNDPSYRSGPSFCPTIKSTFDGKNEILVPFGAKKAIKVKVRIIGQFIVQTRFVCQFKVEGRIVHVNAQLLAETIYCDNVELTYTSKASNITASFDVIWGGSKPLENPDNIHLLIYRCNGMANNCSNCLELPERFGCGWCQSSSRCEAQEHCKTYNDWLSCTQTCPISG